MAGKTVLVFGATGLVGKSLVLQLAGSEHCDKVRIFVRHPTDLIVNQKIEEHIIDFDNLDASDKSIIGDELFICTGTTIKKAGSVSNMEKIDRDLPVKIASIASKNGVHKLIVISSVGADEKSSNYYLRIKGEMEKGLQKLPFSSIIIVRPSFLLGKRDEKRTGESIIKFIMKAVNPLFVGKMSRFRAMESADIARSMINATNSIDGIKILEPDSLKNLAAH